MEEMIQIHLIGRLKVLRGDEDVSVGDVDRQQCVLSYLAYKAVIETMNGKPVPKRLPSDRDELIRLLWPSGVDAETAETEPDEDQNGFKGRGDTLKKRLKTMLTTIRKKLEIPSVSRNDVLSLDPLCFGPRVLIDVEEELKRIHLLSNAPPSLDRVIDLIKALKVWKNELLPEQSGEHISILRRAHTENFAQFVQVLANACDIQDSTPRHWQLAQRASLEVDECMQHNDVAMLTTATIDNLYAARMCLAIAAHKPSKALEIAKEHQEEVGTEVGPKVRNAQQRAHEALRLVDIQRRNRSLDPARFTFVGRKEEREQLQGHLLTHPKLLTVTGPPGVGKTRIVEETASLLQAEYAYQVYSVALQTLTHVDQVVSAIMRSLGLDLPSSDVLNTLISALSRSPALLILDNCEHLLEAKSDFKELVSLLITQVSTLTCLATSRTCFYLANESEMRITPLPLPRIPRSDETSHTKELTDNDCVKLFIEAASERGKPFRIITRNAHAVRDLCIALDGLPLAIILVASWASTYTPRELLANIEQVKTRDGTASDDLRHVSLDAAIAVSYEKLPRPLADLFERLSVFWGGWTLDAAQAVCGSPDSTRETMEDALQELADRSLVDVFLGVKHVRYNLLETLRAFGTKRLTDHKQHESVAKHAQWFVMWAEQTHAKLKGAEQVEWLALMETDHGNLREALNWWLDQGEAEEALRLCAALQQFWWRRGYLEEGRRQSDAVLAAVENPCPTNGLAGVLYGAGNIAMMQGDYPQARVYLERCVAVREALQDVRGSGAALNTLGLLARRQGNYQAARESYEQALVQMRLCEDREGISACLDNLGVIATDLSDFRTASQYHEQSLALHREVGNERGIATVLQNVARAAKKQGDYTRARALLEESLTIRRKLGDRQGIADTLNNLGNIALEQHELSLAQRFHEESLSLRHALGIRPGIASSLTNLGILARLAENYPEAYTLFQQSLAIRRDLGDRSGTVLTLSNLGHLAYALGDTKTAYAYLNECLQESDNERDNEHVAWAWEGYAILSLACGNVEAAAMLRAAADNLRTQVGLPRSPTQQEWLQRNTRQLDEVTDTKTLARWSVKGANMPVQEVMRLALSLKPPDANAKS